MKKIILIIFIFTLCNQFLYSQSKIRVKKEAIDSLILSIRWNDIYFGMDREVKEVVIYFWGLFGQLSPTALPVYNFEMNIDSNNDLSIFVNPEIRVNQIILLDSSFVRKMSVYPCKNSEVKYAISFLGNRQPIYPHNHPDYPGALFHIVSEEQCKQNIFPEHYFSHKKEQDIVRFYTNSFNGKYGIFNMKTKKISFQVEVLMF